MGKTAVIKLGGDVLLDPESRGKVSQNVRVLSDLGYGVVILHGGGPQVNALQEALGLTPNKVGGRRITGPEDLKVVIRALCGEVNVALTQSLVSAGLSALGMHGASAGMIRAHKRPPRVVSGGGEEPVDFGEVGDVDGINHKVLRGLLELGLIPVIATLGINIDEGRVFNINADTTVVQIAAALKADLLLLTTQVGGVFERLEDPETRFAQLTREECRDLIQRGIIAGGMIPKVEEALAVLEDGVGAIAIVGCADPGAFADIAENRGNVGTKIVP